MDDERIVELFLNRKEEAIARVTEKYGIRLRNLANGILNDWTAAQECENDTYLEAWNAIPPHRPGDYLFAFLARITRHLSLDRCRSRSRLKRNARLSELTREMEQCIPSPNDTECQVEGILLGEVVSAFLRGIPGEQRNVFLRRYWYLESVSEISRRFGISESKVKTMLFRCRNRLREYLEKEGYDL